MYSNQFRRAAHRQVAASCSVVQARRADAAPLAEITPLAGFQHRRPHDQWVGLLVQNVTHHSLQCRLVPQLSLRAFLRPPRSRRRCPESPRQRPRGPTLEVAKDFARFRVAGHADDEVEVVEHDRGRRDPPGAVAGRFQELEERDTRLRAGQVDRRAVHALAGRTLQTGDAHVVRRSVGGVVHANVRTVVIRAVVPDVADEPARVAGEPVAVTGVREEPVAVHDRTRRADWRAAHRQVAVGVA